MDAPQPADVWASGDAYEPYVGRWSRAVAHQVLTWLAVAAGGGGSTSGVKRGP
jgi:hypothetical protein